MLGFAEDFQNANSQDNNEALIEEREKQIKEFQEEQEDREVITYSKRKTERLLNLYSNVVVHDYGDGYHNSAEELEKQNVLYNIYQKINGKKTKYRRLDEYITATRDCFAFATAVAERQRMYPKDKFLELWSRGKIKINGMYIPKYLGKDRKRISAKALSEFILSNEDPKNFLSGEEVPLIDSEEMLKEEIETLFEPERFQKIMQTTDEHYDHLAEENMLDASIPSSYKDMPFATPMNKKNYKALMKENPGMMQVLKETLRGSRLGENYQEQMIWEMNEDDYDMLEKYDHAYGVKSSTDIPEFKGSLMNKKDFDKYMEALEDWEWENVKVRENGRYISKEEANEIRLKESLDRAGYNIRMLFGNNRKEEQEVRKLIKKERKREEQLRRELASVSERREKIKKGKTTEMDVYRELLKKKKKSKKKKVTKTQTIHKKDPRLEKAVKRKKKKVNEVLLSVADTNKSFKEYEKDALNFTWESIGGGKN